MLLCLESFVKQSRDPRPLKRSRWPSPQMPSEAAQNFRPPWKRPQLSRNALWVIPEQDRGLASPLFPSRHLPEVPWPPSRTSGDCRSFCPPGPRLSCCSEASPGPPGLGPPAARTLPPRSGPDRPRQQDRARSQRRRTQAGRRAALTSGPRSTAHSQGDLGSVRPKATQCPHRKPGDSTVPERAVRTGQPCGRSGPLSPLTEHSLLCFSACPLSAALTGVGSAAGARPALTPRAEPRPRTVGSIYL